MNMAVMWLCVITEYIITKRDIRKNIWYHCVEMLEGQHLTHYHLPVLTREFQNSTFTWYLSSTHQSSSTIQWVLTNTQSVVYQFIINATLQNNCTKRHVYEI